MNEDVLESLRTAQRRISQAQDALAKLGYRMSNSATASNSATEQVSSVRNDIYDALLKLSPPLAYGYAQAKIDIKDVNRSSWAGTAHEIREVLRNMLDLLAPDEEVKKQGWFKLEQNARGPSHKQKVIHIMKKRGAGSKEREVLEQVEVLEERIGQLVRATYSRASDAAHQAKDRNEVIRILNYFDAFAHDLLDVP